MSSLEPRNRVPRYLSRYLSRWERDVAEWGEQAAREMRGLANCGGERIAQDGSPPPVGADDQHTNRGRSGY
jgi:hypothetical protein